MRQALASVIVKTSMPFAGSLWPTRTHWVLLTPQPLAVDLFTKYGAHGFDAGSDHVWVDDTSLHMWILCFRIGGLSIMVWMVLFSRGSTRLACVGHVLPSENWRHVSRCPRREGL